MPDSDDAHRKHVRFRSHHTGMKENDLLIGAFVDRYLASMNDDDVAWLERFFLLFARNQWKRERYAPSFHVDDANLDPKTWCRFPILSGGFERELTALRSDLRRRGIL